MSEYVLPLRYVNTPTVMELWETEHAKEPAEHAEEEVEELSDEYDTKADVTGTEGYYQWVMTHMPAVRRDVSLYSGNEGIWGGIKNGLTWIVENIKKFFKWVFSFFTSKQRMVDQTADKLEKTIKIKGVKEGDIPYPKDYQFIWNAEGKPGHDIGWIKSKLTEIENAIKNEGRGYIKALKEHTGAIGTVLINHAQLSKAKEDMAKAETVFTTKLAEVIKPGPFLAGVILGHGKGGKLITNANPKIGRSAKGLTFKATVSVVENILGAIQTTNNLYGEFTKEVVEMENVFVQRVNDALKLGNSLELENEAAAKALADKVKQTLTTNMANIKLLETLLYRAINAALSVANAAVKKDGSEAKTEDAK